MSNSSSTFCVLPWLHLYVGATGNMRPCCMSKEFPPVPKIHKQSIEDYWNGKDLRELRQQMLKGERPSVCQSCWDKEDNGDMWSKRLCENSDWQHEVDFNKLVNNTDADGSIPNQIKSFDLRLGNLCNLKCVMCFPANSSKWLEDKNILNKYENTVANEARMQDAKWPQETQLWDYLDSQMEHIQFLQFAGGEPLLHKQHFSLLRRLCETGDAKHIVLKYNTNVTILPKEVYSLWKQFKSVQLWCSIDGYKELNDYIRYPSDWKTIEENLLDLDNTGSNIDVRVNCTVSALNVKYLPELYNYFEHSNYTKIGKVIGEKGLHIAPDLVYTPKHLNIRVIPKHEKEAITEKLSNHLQEVSNEQYKTQLQYVIDYMNQEDWSKQWPTLLKYVEELDKIRGNKYPYELPQHGK